jgi:uncharacterized small protein (DUF1192 family)
MIYCMDRSLRSLSGCIAALTLAGCAGLTTHPPPVVTQASPAVKPAVSLEPYFKLLNRMAMTDAEAQTTTLTETRALSEQAPSASHRLLYALALGSPGQSADNWREARGRLQGLLTSPGELRSDELALAQASLTELNARIALQDELARQHDELARRSQTVTTDLERRNASLTSENTRLKRALAEAQRKLEAVADMERALNGDRTAPRP